LPECVEVAIFRDQLQSHLNNKTLTNVEVISGRYQSHLETWKLTTLPLQVQSIQSHGKFLWWELSDNQVLLTTMGMTGRWSLKEEKHNRVKFKFSDQSVIYFNDVRNFGTIQFGSSQDRDDKLHHLGPSPLQEEITFQKIAHKLKPQQPLGEMLLNQEIIAGIGNYLRSEICYAAKISPLRPISSLSRDDWNSLLHQINFIPKFSYQHGGATLKDYYNLNGERGKFAERFAVYGRKFDPNNLPITRALDKNKRALWFVPELQK
jgi:formamidopyrimidine-DNA glycosylase